MNKQKYRCEYCGKPMSRYDYENYKGVCGKCRELKDWKDILKNFKNQK